MSKLGPADNVEKKMTENGALLRKLVFLAIFTIHILPNHTKHVSISKLRTADSMEKKMTENGPLVQKLAFLAIFTIPYPSKPYKNLCQCLS